jgi:glycosidase
MTPRTDTLRIHQTSHPVLYEVNARVLIRELSEQLGKKVTLGTIPDEVLDEWADSGFDAVWLMGVWTTGQIGLSIARSHSGLREEYLRALPDLTDDDIIGSPYAVKSYAVSRDLGGNFSLRALRTRMRRRGLALVLDFVVNHTARDCKWVDQHPEYYVQGTGTEDIDQPEYYFRSGAHVVAYGRDPYFPGWTDTAQLNFNHPGLRSELTDTLRKVADLCDGVRCDMAMLVLEEVFQRTWGDRARPAVAGEATGEFWSEAISRVRERYPRFVFIAEAYWDLEWKLQQLGFDYTYDKKLYDRLLREGAGSVYDHLKAEMDFQKKSVRFIENHDEPRAADVLSSPSWQFAAATIISTIPGMVLLHEGQLDGWKRKLPVQLGRRVAEVPSAQMRTFYRRLLSLLTSPVFRQGAWQLLKARQGWPENHSWADILTYWWSEPEAGNRFIVVNYAPHNSQCYVHLPLEDIHWTSIEFRDTMSDSVYARERNALSSRGMYFDLPAYGVHIFDVREGRK